MTTKKIVIALALLLSAAPAAMAQSAYTTGSVLNREAAGYPSPYGNRIEQHRNGLNAYAFVPGATSSVNPNSPAETGGGSTGYNQMLLQY